jgi:hypothetical protein
MFVSVLLKRKLKSWTSAFVDLTSVLSDFTSVTRLSILLRTLVISSSCFMSLLYHSAQIILSVLDCASNVALLVSALNCFAFVVVFLAFADGDDDFDEASAAQKFGRYDTHTGLFLFD